MQIQTTQDLPRASPEQMGIASSALLDFVRALDTQINEIHSLMLVRHGHVIVEGWWSPYGPEYPHMLFSVSKSFTSTAVGLAVAEGRFSLDDPVLSFFPDEAPDNADVFLAAMRVRDLLSMTTGHADDTWAFMMGGSDPNWIKAFFSVPVVHAPGTHFLYNTGASYMLSAIVQKTTGMTLLEYLTPRLFEPLGITGATWDESPQGINLGGIGLNLKTEDLARFGQLYLQKGQWRGQQILSEAWVEDATTAKRPVSDNPYNDWAQGYGYQFWRCRHGAYRADGVFSQCCIIMPEQDAVLVFTSGTDVFDTQQLLDVVWDKLLPAFCPAALPDDEPAQAALSKTLLGLALPPVQGQTTSPLAAQISGRPFTADANDLKIETIMLTFNDVGCELRFRLPTHDEVIPCGCGTWQMGQSSLFNSFGTTTSNPLRVAASGAWTSEDRFTVIARLNETPFYHTLIFDVLGDEIMIEARVNVSLESTTPLLLTAHS